MPVTVVKQKTGWSTKRTNFLLNQIAKTALAGVKPSPNPCPHDALETKPKNFESQYNVTVARLESDPGSSEREHDEHWLPLLIKPTKSAKSKRLLLFWHGGAFVNMANPGHWVLLGKLSNDLDMDVALQTYTMAPHAGIHQNIDNLLRLYERCHKIAKENGQEFIVGGDSAGGNIAAAVLLAVNDRHSALPDQVFMLSPNMDVHLDQPANRALEKVDPMLNIDRFSAACLAWAVGPTPRDDLFKPAPPTKDLTPQQLEALRHPYASPVRGDWGFLGVAKVPVTLVQGTYDLLLPQVEQFVDKCRDADVELTYIRAEGCCHVYPILSGLPGANLLAPDSIEGYNLMVQSIRKYCKT